MDDGVATIRRALLCAHEAGSTDAEAAEAALDALAERARRFTRLTWAAQHMTSSAALRLVTPERAQDWLVARGWRLVDEPLPAELRAYAPSDDPDDWTIVPVSSHWRDYASNILVMLREVAGTCRTAPEIVFEEMLPEHGPWEE